MDGTVEAVVFDCDGLLLDTEDLWARGESDLFAEYGREYTEADRKMLLGASVKTLGNTLADMLGQPGREESLSAELLSRCWEEVVAEATPRPGAVEIVRDLNARGDRLPVGVASNSPRALVEEALGVAGLGDAFDVIVGVDDIGDPKPAAEIYLHSCERLGVRPSRSVAFEDSATGVTAARAAGMFVIGVPSTPDTVLDAHIVADSLSDTRVRAKLSLA